MSTTTTMLDAALEYARRGDAVVPVWHAEGDRCGCRAYECESPGKHPIGSCTPNGLKDATTDEAAITRWWTLFPKANIATRTGCTRTVLDVDASKGGFETLARLEAQHGALPTTAKVLTGGGGAHFHFQPAPGIRNSAGKLGEGLDVRGEDGYVLLPPSNHVSGDTYLDDLLAPLYETPLAPMPAWLVAQLVAATTSNGNGHHAPSDEWAAMLTGAPEGQRREAATKIAGHFLGLLGPARESEVLGILLGFAARCTPPFPEHEALALVRDLARKDRVRARHDRAARPAVAADAVSTATPDGVILTRLSDVAPEAVEWLWLNRLVRGGLGVGLGMIGSGKTTLFIGDIASRITTGAEWPDAGRAPLGDVIVLTAEDGLATTIRPHIDRQNGDPSRVFAIQGVRVSGAECAFNFERDLPELERVLIANPATVLVVVDPLSAYLGSRDSYKDAEIRGLLTPLHALAEKYRVAVLGIMHPTKGTQRSMLLRAQGSIAFVAAARTVLVVGEDPETPGRRLLVCEKNNLGPKAPTLAFRIDDHGLSWLEGTVEGNADTLLAGDEVPTRSESREREAAAAFLRDLLANGPVASREVYADARSVSEKCPGAERETGASHVRLTEDFSRCSRRSLV